MKDIPSSESCPANWLLEKVDSFRSFPITKVEVAPVWGRNGKLPLEFWKRERNFNFFKLRYNSHTMPFTLFQYTFLQVLTNAYSQVTTTTIQVWNNRITPQIFSFHFIPHNPQALTTTNLFSLPIILPFLLCHIMESCRCSFWNTY